MRKPAGRFDAYVLVSPAALFLAIFWIFPLVLVLALSLFQLNLVDNTLRFVGLGNYASELTSTEFGQSLSATVLYALWTIVPSLGIGLLVAVLINGLRHGQGFWRSVYFLPVASTLVAMSSVWRWMFHPDVGIADHILRSVFGAGDWLNDTHLALVALAVVGNWHQIGFAVVLYLAALGRLPREPYDSAAIDGAGAWSRFWHVTWPALGPTTVFVFVLMSGYALQTYDTIAAMTAGGPAGATATLTYRMWVRGIQYLDAGRAAVLAVVLLALSLVVTAIQRGPWGRRLEAAGTR
jgi:multiple sugar transport system permease protein